MNRLSRRSFVGVAVSAIFLPLGVSGQQADADEILQNLPGLKSAYARRYAPADEGAPMLSGDWPVEPTGRTPQYLLAMVLTFDNALVVQGLVSTMLNPDIAATVLGRSSEGLIPSTNQALPKGNVLFAGTDADEHFPYGSLLVLPIGVHVYLLHTEGDSAAVQATADDIAGFIANAEPARSNVSVIRQGVAVGGPFAVLPDAEDAELLNGLYPFADYDLLAGDSPILPTDVTDGATPNATPQSGASTTVEMTAAARFEPEELVITVGQTVEWINTSDIEHTATCDPEQNPFKKTRPELITLPGGAEPWGSELLAPGERFSHTFTVPGEYHYICFPHVLSGMQGVIRVEA